MGEGNEKLGSPRNPSIGEKAVLASALLFVLLIYVACLAPSVVAGDTGDYLTAGWIWGVSHPPGYPLYTMLVGLFERLPLQPVLVSSPEISVIAWRGNLLSAIISVCALWILFELVRRTTSSSAAGIVSVAALSFSRTWWWHSEIAENDTLTALFLLSVFLAAVRWAQERKPGDPYLLAFIAGLALSHHQSLLLFLPAVIVYLATARALRFAFRQWLAFALLFVLGLLPFLYLPMVSYRTVDGPLRFVSSREYRQLYEEGSHERFTDTRPIDYFVNYIARTIYGEARRHARTEDTSQELTTTADVARLYVDSVANDFGVVFACLGLAGLAAFFLRARKPSLSIALRKRGHETTSGSVMLVAAYAVYLLTIMLLPSGDILNAPMYNLQTAGPALMLPLHVLWAAFAGLGAARIVSIAHGTRQKAVLPAVVVVLSLAASGWNYFRNKPHSDKSQNTLMQEYCLNVLESCPPDACLVVAGDELYAFWYVKHVHIDRQSGVQGVRPDVRLYAWTGELETLAELADTGRAMASAVVRVARSNPGKEIDTTFFNTSFLETPELADYTLARRGLLFAFVPPGRLDGFIETPRELAGHTGIRMYQPGVPEEYRWRFWQEGGETGQFLWAPEKETQWRIAEMLLFYEAALLMAGDTSRAAIYRRLMDQVEPRVSGQKD